MQQQEETIDEQGQMNEQAIMQEQQQPM